MVLVLMENQPLVKHGKSIAGIQCFESLQMNENFVQGLYLFNN